MAGTISMDVPLLPGDNGTTEDEIPESRIRDGWHAHAIFRRLDLNDTISEAQRANIDYMIDGGKPYSDQAMADAGRGEDANVNFMIAKAEDDLAQTPFIEITTVVQRLWNIRSDFGDEDQKKKNSDIISEEFTRTVRAWGEDFDYFRLRLAQQFTRHGPAYVYWEDEFDWRWRSDGPTAFKLPRNTESRASAIPYCVCKRTMSVEELYSYIRDEPHAAEVGRWNIDAVKRALASAVTAGRVWTDNSWEEFQAEAKENDIEFSSRSQELRVFHLWCKEFNGSVSHYLGMQNGVVLENGTMMDTHEQKKGSNQICGDGFLYAHRFRFPKFESCIIPFFYSIGTHGTVHTIRAQGEMNFATCAVANRTMNKLIDCAGASSSIIVEADSASEAEAAAYRQVGAFMIKGGGGKIVASAMPDVSARLEPVLDLMSRTRQAISPNASGSNAVDKSKQPQNKYQIQANQNKDSALGSSMLTQFFGPWARVGSEMYRRMMSDNLSELNKGGKEAFDFRARCMKRGVPKEAMDPSICVIDAVRAIGNGSPGMRQAVSEGILELSEQFDEEGRYNAVVDAVAAKGVPWNTAVNYVGPPKGRTNYDNTAANLENGLFKLGQKQPVEPDQNDWVHCQIHQQLVSEFVDAFNQQQIDGAKLVPVLDAALANMLEHSEKLSKNDARQKESAEVRAFIQQSSGILQQQQEKLLAEQQRAQEDQQQPQGGQEPDPDAQRKSEEHSQKIARMQQELQLNQQLFLQKLQQQDANAQQTRRIKDLEAARKMASSAI